MSTGGQINFDSFGSAIKTTTMFVADTITRLPTPNPPLTFTYSTTPTAICYLSSSFPITTSRSLSLRIASSVCCLSFIPSVLQYPASDSSPTYRPRLPASVPRSLAYLFFFFCPMLRLWELRLRMIFIRANIFPLPTPAHAIYLSIAHAPSLFSRREG